MLIIDHRINTIEALGHVPAERGAEIDLRDREGTLCLQHEAMRGGETLQNWLKAWSGQFLVFNTKCDGIEEAILDAATVAGVKDFFLLDLANPTLIKLARRGENRLAVRFSEYEPVEAALAFAGLAQWCWVDCFTKMPLTPDIYKVLKKHFKLCVVSPELQGRGRSAIAEFRESLKTMSVDAVCTDFPESWKT